METNKEEMVKGLTTSEIESIKTFYAIWGTKQPELLDEICTPDWKDMPLLPNQAAGPKGLQDIIKGFTTDFPDIEINILEIFGTHERAAVRAEIVFTHNKELIGIPATDKKVSVAIHEFHYLKDGKITHTWHLEDWFGLLMQSGGFKPNN